MNEGEILPAPVLDLRAYRNGNEKWERERDAFKRLLPELLKAYRNQYVAIHEGQVVEAGANIVEVAQRAYSQCGYVPIYVDLVTDEPIQPVRIPSPRAFRIEPQT